jgi:serine/threonine-protein kinase HipA
MAKDLINVLTDNALSGELSYDREKHEYIFNYKVNRAISLTMPYRKKSYISNYSLHPIFDMHMPEGYLYELFKKYLLKELKELDDFTLFKFLSRNVIGHLCYESDVNINDIRSNLTLQDILDTSSEDLFSSLIEKFLFRSQVSGVQPKFLANLEDKLTLQSKEYIVKSFGDEYPHLAENEFFCMSAIKYAGIPTPQFYLSKSKKIFIIERFDYDKKSKIFLGFEDACALLKQNKEQKYKGSYEKIASLIDKISTDKFEDFRIFFKMLTMSYMLRNGDAHLKNFGFVYNSDLSSRRLAPAYDVICTTAYLPKDKPALSMYSRAVWFSHKKLIKFAKEFCYISEKDANGIISECKLALTRSTNEMKHYIKDNPDFIEIGSKMIDYFENSLEQTETLKEL